jgi:hypothetical protein
MLKKFIVSMAVASSVVSGVYAQETMNHRLASVKQETLASIQLLYVQLDDINQFVMQPLADIVRDYVTSLNSLKDNLLKRNDLDADTAKVLQDELDLAGVFNQDIISYEKVVTVSLGEIIRDMYSALAQEDIICLKYIMRDLQRLKETGVEWIAKFKQSLNDFNCAATCFAPVDKAIVH